MVFPPPYGPFPSPRRRITRREFRDELLVLRNLRHPNIVQFLGAVTKSQPLMLITEYLSNVSEPWCLHACLPLSTRNAENIKGV